MLGHEKKYVGKKGRHLGDVYSHTAPNTSRKKIIKIERIIILHFVEHKYDIWWSVSQFSPTISIFKLYTRYALCVNMELRCLCLSAILLDGMRAKRNYFSAMMAFLLNLIAIHIVSVTVLCGCQSGEEFEILKFFWHDEFDKKLIRAEFRAICR